jgi:stage II sporulation protein E
LAELAEEVAAASEAPAEAAAPVPAGPPLLTRWERAAGSGALGYEVVAAFLPRPGRSLSGDSVRCRLLRGDRLALVLSDGMGSGEPAAVVSAATAEHVLACLAAGRSPTDALRQTNEQLAADSPGERFATVDLAIVHLRGGLLEWYKMGAAPAWLSQGRGVRELGGGGLPAGILPAPEIRSGRTRLRPGESLVLVSDGILDRPVGAALGRAGRGRWAADWLRRHQVHAGGAALAQGLCEAARQRTAGGVHDDLTVVVCRLCETVGAGGSAYGAGDAAGAGAAGGA